MRRALIAIAVLSLTACGAARPALAPDAGSSPPPACTGANDASWPGWREDHPRFLLVHVGASGLSGGVAVATEPDPFEQIDGGACDMLVSSAVLIPQPYTVPSAGVLTISSPHATTTVLPDDGGAYPGAYDLARHPAPGHLPCEPITVAGTGAEIPPFSLTVNSPLAPVILTPAFPPDGGPLIFDADAGLEITWANAGCGDQVVIELESHGVDVSGMLRCAVPASQGQFTIPPELASGMSGLAVESYRAAVGDAGAWPVVEQVSAFAVQPDGRTFAGNLSAR